MQSSPGLPGLSPGISSNGLHDPSARRLAQPIFVLMLRNFLPP
jgi:hypothetical protein